MIRNVILRVTDLARALDFYERGLQGVVVAHNARRIVLDFDTATLELHEVPDAVDNQWSEDDAVVGFRHIGFKVPSVDRALVALKALGFHARLGPVDLERAGIRAVLLYDADHVNIELVERHLHYDEIHDGQLVMQELSMPDPDRPRFDHIGLTARSLEDSARTYGALGFTLAGGLRHPEGLFRMAFFRSHRSALEIFTFLHEPESYRPPPDAQGFVGIELDGAKGDREIIELLDDDRVAMAGPDGLAIIVRPSSEGVIPCTPSQLGAQPQESGNGWPSGRPTR